MDDPMHALLEVHRGFETQFKESKQEYMDNLHLDMELRMKSIPAKYKGPIQQWMDVQVNVLTSRLSVVSKCQIKEVLLHFANNNPDVNGYAFDVIEMLTCGIVANPEDNLTNQLMGTDVGHVSELANLEVKVEMDQDSTEVVLSPVASSDDLELQLSTSSHSKDEAIPVINQLPQLVGPVLEQNSNNRPLVIEPPVHISKKDMWKKLPLEPTTCLVKDCGTKFDYRRIRQDHIDKDHKNTRVWHCALCHKHYTTYANLESHFQKKHAFKNFQCTFANCAFTNKSKRQVTKHFKECHMVSAIVNNHMDKSTNKDSDDGDDDLSKDEVNSEENANVRPINQGSMATVPSPEASGSDDSNDLPVVQQPSTSTEHKTMKRSIQSGNNEECNQVYVDGHASVKKAKLNSTHSNNAQRVDQSPHRCIIEHCGLSFDNLDDLDQHTKLVHSQLNQLAISAVENALTTIQSTGPIVPQQSSISTEPTTSIHFEVPVTSRLVSLRLLESHDNEECIDVADQGQSSSFANNHKLDATLYKAQSQVTNGPEQISNAKDNLVKVPKLLNKTRMVILLGLKCFQLNCKRVFDTKEKLNHHMWKRHRIRAFPCLVKDCGKSFDDIGTRNYHIKNDHNDGSEWRKCAKCEYNSYKTVLGLPSHYKNCHSTQYQCSFGSCTFSSEDKRLIWNHYVQAHMIACRQPACTKKSYAHAVKSQFEIIKHYHYI